MLCFFRQWTAPLWTECHHGSYRKWENHVSVVSYVRASLIPMLLLSFYHWGREGIMRVRSENSHCTSPQHLSQAFLPLALIVSCVQKWREKTWTPQQYLHTQYYCHFVAITLVTGFSSVIIETEKKKIKQRQGQWLLSIHICTYHRISNNHTSY